MKKITIGIPVFNEEENIELAYKALLKVLPFKKYKFEILFANNGSTDKSEEIIESLYKKDKRVKGVMLSRNFGPEATMNAILDFASSDALVIWDCDMQDPEEIILEFIKYWEKGFPIVVGKYTNTQDPLIMKVLRRSFYRLFKIFANIDVPVNSSTFSLLDKNVVMAIRSLPEKYRFFRGLRAWVGFDVKFVEYQRRKRKFGRSAGNLLGYLRYSERSFFGFSYLPLDIIIYLGLVLVFFAFIFIAVYLILVFFFGNPINGSVAIFVSIILFGGIQLLAISIIGKYIQVIVEEAKARPVYIVKRIVGGVK